MSSRVPSDTDQYCRVFIIGAKDCSAADIRDAFGQFGEITDVYIPRRKTSHENMGQFCLPIFPELLPTCMCAQK